MARRLRRTATAADTGAEGIVPAPIGSSGGGVVGVDGVTAGSTITSGGSPFVLVLYLGRVEVQSGLVTVVLAIIILCGVVDGGMAAGGGTAGPPTSTAFIHGIPSPASMVSLHQTFRDLGPHLECELPGFECLCAVVVRVRAFGCCCWFDRLLFGCLATTDQVGRYHSGFVRADYPPTQADQSRHACEGLTLL
jgi:hypothetical protein